MLSVSRHSAPAAVLIPTTVEHTHYLAQIDNMRHLSFHRWRRRISGFHAHGRCDGTFVLQLDPSHSPLLWALPRLSFGHGAMAV
ncbi:hypothetical protein AB1Y20_011786 [Prymnesium parvum]|uniref:Uncharacterized protein n=1 Tax=Prymnesium parvum TaxID=97485 RepID=A0AB34IK10_PRYPA